MTNKTEALKASLQQALKNLEGYSLVSTDLLTQLKDDSDFLECLKVKGVDNWSGYDLIREMYYNEE